ncbi:MAG: MBL fold metallo-hydrolase [Desulfobulbaceae bacterium]|jgi:phosphoribosyl 1,2-cyclic phosphodiesterase|nr:MBL fold metallo-hydrolase [Desulfobulbaceae bacterium]MDY0350103.1 MBL fold metallo-hydrolase [Desulfobulbaceae bacterium]
MKFCVLGSGSRGNATLVESGGTALLIDAGFSGVEIRRRLGLAGRQPEKLAAILVTHEHNDHISGVGVLSRQARVPVHANPATLAAAAGKLGTLFAIREFSTGEGFELGGLQIHPFAISHDTADPVGFIISDGDFRLGYCTDTGRITRLIEHHLRQCHALILESNHDPRMLREGPYPLRLQQRVLSGQGHLANEDAGSLLNRLAGGVLQYVVLAHLSEINNLPELALRAARNGLGEKGVHIEIVPACQGAPCRLIDLRRK